MISAPLYTEHNPEELNQLIANRKEVPAADWSGDLNLAIDLVGEVCQPAKGSTYTRALSIGAENRNGRAWFEITNIFTQEDNGDYTLLQGWNESKDSVIWFEGPDLAPLCCLTWLTVTELAQKAKKTQKAVGVALYDKLTQIANQKRIEAVSDSLEESLKSHALILSREVIEAAVSRAFEA